MDTDADKKNTREDRESTMRVVSLHKGTGLT